MTTVMLNEKLSRQNRGLVVLMVRTFREKLARRALKSELLKMDDHQLRDVGLSRHAVHSDEF